MSSFLTPAPRIKILLIEDRMDYAVMLRMMLSQDEDQRFQIEHVQTLAAALPRIGQGGIELILLDLGLPDSRGFDTFAQVAAAAREIPILVLSAQAEETLAVQTVQNGAQDYLIKGERTDRHALKRAMTYALERKRAQLELERAHGELEKRVAERTAELTRANEELQREVAERLRAENALRESNRQLSEAMGRLRDAQKHLIQRERLHALGGMASGIAHDFNNALAPILGFSELLLLRPEHLFDHQKVRSYLETIHTSAQSSAQVVARLREFYRYREEAEFFAAVSLNDVVLHAISNTEPFWKEQAAEKGIQITFHTDFEESPEVCGNEPELREMVSNLVLNAVEAIAETGSITFSTSSVGNEVLFQVIDTGAGMTDEIRARCFEPFFSTKEQHGAGLGLGIVHGIVRRHEGKIEIESAPGAGTSVKVWLPVFQEQAASQKPDSSPASEHSLRVLVVEDEPMVRELVSVFLSEDHHQIETAENGRIGLEKFKAGAFDLVLTDRVMPEMRGDELAAAIKAINPAMPIVLLTGFGDMMTEAGEQPAGVDLIVGKPFTLGELRDAIARVVQVRS